jgi:RHS repeat-associated protein
MRTIILLLGLAAPCLAASTVPNPSAAPATIPVNSATQVLVTIQITDPTLVAGGVNLLQVTSAGASPVILGVMHDDGLNGDAKAGDGILTLQVSLKQAAPGSIYLQASAAFKGQLQRVLSPILAVPVVAPPTITDFNPKSAPAGSLITVTGANFEPGSNLMPTVSLRQQGVTGVVTAPLISANAGSLAFAVPINAASGPITISVAGQTAVTATSLNISGSAVFSVTAAPATIALIRGQSGAISVQLSGSNGFSALAALSIANLPTGMTASFWPPSIGVGQTSILTLTAPSSQSLGSSNLTITATAPANGVSLSQSVNTSLTVQAPTTSLVGRTVVSDSLETPLAGVTVTLLGKDGNGNVTSCSGRTTSDGAGNFTLTNLPALCAGPQLVGYDGTTVTAPAGTYAGVNLVYTLTPGQVMAAPVLIHLPRIDNQETFNVQQNATTDQSYAFRSIPGLSVTAYAHTIFTMPDGTHPNPFPLTAVSVPVDRLPDIKPPVPTMITAFIVAFQPANATTNQPVAVYYPNPLNTPSGMNMALLTLDPTHGAMVPYGTGAVSADGTQIVPDLDPAFPGHRYGLVHFDWHMPGYPPGNQLNPCAFCPFARRGDPVDLSSGLFMINETDIGFSGSRGAIAIRRTYRGGINPAATIFGPFGYGTNHNFGYELGVVAASEVSAIPLIMPDGNQFLFSKQGDGTFLNGSGIPMLAGAVMTLDGTGVSLRWKDGTLFQFIQMRVGITFRNLLDSITDTNGNKIQVVHNGFQISDILDPLGRGLHFNYNVGGYITQITAPDGSFVSYDYDGNNANYLRVVTHPDGTTTRYDYDEDGTNGNITAVTDGRGLVVASNTYDSSGSGRVTDQKQADGSMLHFSYMLQNPTAPRTSPVLATTVTDALGHVTVYRFSPAGALLGVTDPLGQTQVFSRDGSNNINAITGAAACSVCGGSTTGDRAFSYDGNGNVLSETDALGNTTHLTYEPVFNKLLSIQDGLGNKTTFAYDLKGNLQSQTDPKGNVTQYQHNAFGELTAITDPANQTTTFTYDAFGNVVAVKDVLGNITSFQYDILGRLTVSQDALGRRTQIAYDNANRIIRQVNAQGKLTTFRYDQVGNLLSVIDPRLSTTSFTYDAMNRPVNRTDPNNRKDTRAYDANGNLIQFQDRRVQTSTFTYDAADRLTGESYQDGSTVARSYDANNRLSAVTDSASGAFSFGYDPAGRLITSTTPVGVVQYVRDALGRATSRQVVGQPAVTYAYDASGNLTSATMPQAAATFAYDARNQLSTLNRLNGVTSAFTYDPAAKLLAITHARGPTMIDTESYQYDTVGNRTSHFTSTGQPLVTTAVSNAVYDADNEQNQFGTASSAFDANGDLTSTGTPTTPTTYTWDSRGRLSAIVTSAGQTTRFMYDFAGNLMAQADSGTSTNLTKTFVLDDLTNVAYESAGDGTSYSVLSGQAIDSHFAIVQSDGQIQYGLSDAVNSTVATVDQAGAEVGRFIYEPFGQTTILSSAYPFQFTGRVPASSGLYYNRARFYNPVTGRFLSEDPLPLSGAPNSYTYALDNPGRYSDPSGYIAGGDDLVLAGGGLLIGIGVQVTTDFLAGHRSDWQHYVGAAYGGAVGGLALEYTAGNPVAIGALASGTTNGVTQAIEAFSHPQCSFNAGQFALNTGLGAAFGALPDFEMFRLSSGQNNWNAIGKALRTKLSNGTIENISGSAAIKALIGANVAGVWATIAGVGAALVMDDGGSCGCR